MSEWVELRYIWSNMTDTDMWNINDLYNSDILQNWMHDVDNV